MSNKGFITSVDSLTQPMSEPEFCAYLIRQSLMNEATRDALARWARDAQPRALRQYGNILFTCVEVDADGNEVRPKVYKEPATFNDLVYAIALRVRTLADHNMDDLRAHAGGYWTETRGEAVRSRKHVTSRGELIEEILCEEFCIENNRTFEEV